MCCETVGGKVKQFGKIRIRPNKFAFIVLPELRYVIFNEEKDVLQLNYRAACVDLEVEARGKTPYQALSSLGKAVNHYVDLAIEDFGNEKAYNILMDERLNKSPERKIAHMSYGQAIVHNYNSVNKKINDRIRLMSIPYYCDLLKRLFFIFSFLFARRNYVSKEEAL